MDRCLDDELVVSRQDVDPDPAGAGGGGRTRASNPVTLDGEKQLGGLDMANTGTDTNLITISSMRQDTPRSRCQTFTPYWNTFGSSIWPGDFPLSGDASPQGQRLAEASPQVDHAHPVVTKRRLL